MALRTASTAKTASDGNVTPTDVTGLAISAIDALIGIESGSGGYILKASFEARISNGITAIKQSDESYIDVETIVLALKENGYRVSYNKRTDPGDYLLCLQVAWN